MTEKSLKFGNKIIVFALILLTSLFSLALYFTLDRTPVSAIIDGTTQTRLTENLYDTNGNLVSSAIVSLLNSISYLEHLNDMGTYEAHQIVSRNNDDDYSGDNTIVFPMGYYVDSSGNMDTSKPLYWQVVYLNNNYLTIWLDKGYTMAYYNRNGTPKNGFDPGNDYSSNSNYYSNYSKSQLRDTALNIFSLLSNNLNNFEQIIVSPNIAANKTDGTNWQSSQPDIYTSSSSSSYAHHNGMGSSSGSSYSWGSSDSGCTWNYCLSDIFWIPSAYEVFNTNTGSSNRSDTNGLWGLNANDSGFSTGGENSINYDGTSAGTFNGCWLRSGKASRYDIAIRLNSSGSSADNGVNGTNGVRPACHIDLNALEDMVDDMVDIITVRSSNESQGTVSGGGEYVVGTSSTTVMTATPNTGYIFLYWQDSSSVQYYNNPLIVPVTGDETYTAYFRQSYVTITTSNDSAEIDSSIVDTTGTTTSLNLTFNTGNYISGITVNNGVEYPVNAINGTLAVNDNSCTAIDFRTNPAGSMLYLAVYGARAEVTITLHFVNIEQSYTPASGGANIEGVALQVSGGEGSNLEAVGEARITGYTTTNNLTTVHVSAVASSGYYFVGWETSDGTDLSTYGSTADIPYDLVEGKILTAVFAPNPSNSQTNGSTDNTSGEIV